MPVVSLRNELDSSGKMVQKGPATDYSMLLEMKRRSVMVSDSKNHGDLGRKGTGIVVDNMKQRGFTEGPAVPVLKVRGAVLGFFRF